jgi:hypothetical protein
MRKIHFTTIVYVAKCNQNLLWSNRFCQIEKWDVTKSYCYKRKTVLRFERIYLSHWLIKISNLQNAYEKKID